jgi:asparagine synthase (glutamine-hydrolysing)
MCGIAGVFNYTNDLPVSLDLLRTINKELLHRGPDDEGFYVKDNIGLAFRRLSIIDLYTGNQPIHNEDKTVWVIFNGEIYNYIELKESLIEKGHLFYTSSDTEVIVHSYEEYGEDFIHYLNGMFAIAVWDDKLKVLTLARDRAGIKPLYYSNSEGRIIFASEIKALLKGGVSRIPDYEAINQYLSYGYVPAPLTGFKAIRKLNAGYMLICSSDGCAEREFWDFSAANHAYKSIPETDLTDLLINELTAVLERQTRSDVPIGIFLSAGVDSTLIASVAAMRCNMKLKAFTVGYKEESYSELNRTRLVVERLGLHLEEVILSEKEVINELDTIISAFDEPLMDYSSIPMYFVSKSARSHVKTVVGGEGGDELFGGYQTHYLHAISEFYRKIPRFLRTGIKAAANNLPESHNYFSTSYKIKKFTYGASYPYDEGHYRWKVLFDADEKKKLLGNDFLANVTDLEPFNVMRNYFNRAVNKGFSIQEQLMYVDFKTFMQDDPLQKTDRMSMANSLEVRVPILDNTVIDLSQKIPAYYKIKRFQTKYILRKALSKFLPAEIAFGKKIGFTPPVALWLKHGLKDYMLSSLSDESLSKIGFLNHNYISAIINNHLNGKAENSRQIWSLIVLANWHRRYVCGLSL